MSDLPTVSDIDRMQDNPSSENDPEKAAPGEAGTKTTIEVKPQTFADAVEAPAAASQDPTNHESQLPDAITRPEPNAGAGAAAHAAEPPLLTCAEKELQREIEDMRSGRSSRDGVEQERLIPLCRVIDYWLADETEGTIDRLGLVHLAQEIKKDYVLASLLAWRGEYKLGYISLRSFLESFCLLLYYLNQGCDRLLYLKGKGYKLMLHRMAQKRQPDETHAFRRHYHLLIAESSADEKAADRFFDEIDSCYGVLSKAVHGEYSKGTASEEKLIFVNSLQRVLRICNTLALHDPMLDATEEDMNSALEGVLNPTVFEWKKK
jgi:hypothetical protein